jgi:ABC-2 type transport system permease protein
MVTIAAFQLAVYPSIKKDVAAFEELADSFPEAMKFFFDIENYTSPSGYLNVEMFSLVVPFVFLSVGVAAGAAATAGEEERGTLDILLALPVHRTTVLLDKFAALMLSLLALAAITVGALLVGTRLVDLDISLRLLVEGTAASLLLGLLYGAVGLLLGALTGRRGAALGGGVALALAAFLLESLAPAADWLEPWQPVSPWYWLLGNEPVRNGLDLGYAALSVVVTAAFVGAAVATFRRRDITT